MNLKRSDLRGLAFALALVTTAMASADLTAPSYSSKPGAAYTVYLDFGGFSFAGNWGTTGPSDPDNGQGTPGVIPAYDVDGNTNSFSAQELANIQNVYARVAETYAGFNINVTTVDPAAGMSDAQRQAYYDATPQIMHTVIGGNSNWSGSPSGGLSFLGVTQSVATSNGGHTNFAFSEGGADQLQFVGDVAAHENGHGFGLHHQSDITTNPVTEYSEGDAASAANGNNSVAPIMGDSYTANRGLWRNGTMSNGAIQNDIATILSNNNMVLTDDGVGHSFLTATSLALNGSTVNAGLAKGFINVASATNPTTLGVDSYTKDFFSFMTNGSAIDLVLHAGGELIKTGVADPGAMFDGSFDIFNSAGLLVGQSTRDASTEFYSFDGVLGAGSYYAEVLDFGGYTSDHELTSSYFTSGSYFFTGSGGFTVQATPEPATMAALGLGALAFLKRRKKSA